MPDQSSMTYYRTKLSSWAINSRSANAWTFSQLLGDVSQSSADYDQLLAALRKFCKSISPEPPGSTDQDVAKTLEWRVSDPAGVTRLSDIALPLPSEKVEAVIRKLGLYLASLHEKGLFCLDIAPALTLVCRLHGEVVTIPTWPTPALRDQAIDEDTYIAPEVSAAATADNVSPRSDFYGLGQLAWTLLTGKAGRHPGFVLPSDVAEALAPWDEFIDAMCRPHPDRRPSNMRHALSLLPRKPPPSQGTAEKPQLAKPPLPIPPAAKQAQVGGKSFTKYSRTASRRAIVLGGGLLGLFGLYRTFVSPTSSGQALRGFADTIIRYPDRSYEGAEWKRIHSAAALRGVMPSHSCNYICFANVTGHDDSNLWITCDRDHSAVFFQLRNGHWEYRQTVQEMPPFHYLDMRVQRPRVLTPDTLIPCVDNALYEVTSSAIRRIPGADERGSWSRMKASGPAIIAEDYYFHPRGSSFHDAYVVQNGKAMLLNDSTKKEAFIFSTEHNAPLEEYRVSDIGFTSSFSRGQCIGVCLNHLKALIVEFRDGRWWEKCELTLTDKYKSQAIEPNDITDAFFGTLDGRSPGFALLCGAAGTVIFRDFTGVEEERSVIPRQASTPCDLIRVWGVHPEKYWVMDGKGEVWERKNGQSRVVVRGLHDSNLLDSDTGFNTAWVSPLGNVYAASHNHLFKLA